MQCKKRFFEAAGAPYQPELAERIFISLEFNKLFRGVAASNAVSEILESIGSPISDTRGGPKTPPLQAGKQFTNPNAPR
jgi:hypothetical protein